MSAEVEFVAGPADHGRRLDTALGSREAVGSRSAAERLIEAGGVTVDGSRRPKGHRLQEGERVRAVLDSTARAMPAADPAAPYGIAYEDEHLLVVDKPPGVVVHPAPGHPTGTLVEALAARSEKAATRAPAGGGRPWRPGIVHRLDRDTSGLLVVAKSEEVHRALGRLLRARRIEREYRALVEGRPDAHTGTVDAPIGRDRARRTVMSTRTDRPRGARTHFAQLEALPRTTLLAVRLETGRTHQIRAHLAAIGHPVCGDRDYGGGPCCDRIGLARQFLHSARLAFPHPETGATVECEAELPPDLRDALATAREETGGA